MLANSFRHRCLPHRIARGFSGVGTDQTCFLPNRQPSSACATSGAAIEATPSPEPRRRADLNLTRPGRSVRLALMRRRRFCVAIVLALAYLVNATYCPCSFAFSQPIADQHHCCPSGKEASKHSTPPDNHVDGCQHCSLKAVTSSADELVKTPFFVPSVDVLHVAVGDLQIDRVLRSHGLHGLAPPLVVPPLARHARLQI